jgi:DNA repair protein RadC
MKRYESIKFWSEDDKPREKLARHGKHTLSDKELIGILIGSGIKEKSAIDVAADLLKKANYNLNQLARFNINEYCTIQGIGPAKAITIIAALELAARKELSAQVKNPIMDSSKKVFDLMKGDLQDLSYEQFWLITLSRSNALISRHKISKGGIAGTVVDPKRIYKTALEDHASGIILLHNHPSGALKPSKADRMLTQKLINAGTFLDIIVLDHLIISNQGYHSFADNGELS